MLSQRISKVAVSLRLNLNNSQERMVELEQALQLFTDSNQGLQDRSEELGLEGVNSPEIQLLFQDLAPFSESIQTSAQTILLQAADEQVPDPDEALGSLLQAESHFLPLMDEIVLQYEMEATREAQLLMHLESVMLSVVLFLLGIEALLIFRPAVNTLREQNQHLRKNNAQQQQLAEELSTRNEELLITLERAQEATRLKSEFLATMSHEIRTPMHAAKGMTTLLLDSDLNAVQREYASIVLNSTDNLLALINDILDFTKIESGEIQLELAPLRVRALLNQVTQLFKEETQQKKLQLHLHLDDKLPDCIETDSSRLRQILINLIGNAVKFTERGEISVKVSAEMHEKNSAGCDLSISVSDTGIGIAPEKQSRLFQPFTQADQNIHQRYGGTGLGLAISSRLATALGGQLRCESDEGTGSTFTLSLRSKVLPTSAEEAAPLPQEHFLSKQAHRRSLKVLVADDNDINQTIISIMLQKLGHSVLVRSNGTEALASIDESIDLVLMDLVMPEMDGLECSRLIRELPLQKQPRIVALTANAFDEDRQHAYEAGMDAFLSKPIEVEELIQELNLS